MKSDAIFRIVLCAAGGAAALGGVVTLWRNARLLVTGRRTVGSLESWEQKSGRTAGSGGGMTTYYHPVIRYQAIDGSQHKLVGDFGHAPKPNWTIGRSFRICYDPANPESAIMVSLWRLITPLFISMVGIGMIWTFI
jgi:hypothetical protein